MPSSATMHPRPLSHSLGLMVFTVVAGLAIRFAPLGLPYFVVKYGGSMLWALMIYWIVTTLLPARRLLTVALFAGMIATTVEFGKLCHTPALDAFRLTLPGILLFGRFFSVWDIVAYWLAISIGVLIDKCIRSAYRQTNR